MAIDYLSVAVDEIRALQSQHPTPRHNGIPATGHNKRRIEEISEIEETRIESEKCTKKA
jgi:hypothetical protein